MTPSDRTDVLLLSSSPWQHERSMAALREHGWNVSVASASLTAQRLLRARPPLVLVDLAHPVDLSIAVVRALNAKRGPSLVVALHEGDLSDDVAAISQLSVHGFCHGRDWRPITHIATPASAVGTSTVH